MTQKQTMADINILALSVLFKNIVTFYYNIFFNHSDLLKKTKDLPIDKAEHKNCLALLKAAVSTNINFIY